MKESKNSHKANGGGIVLKLIFSKAWMLDPQGLDCIGGECNTLLSVDVFKGLHIQIYQMRYG